MKGRPRGKVYQATVSFNIEAGMIAEIDTVREQLRGYFNDGSKKANQSAVFRYLIESGLDNHKENLT